MRALQKDVESLKRKFPRGCRVKLVRMDDPQAPPIGTLGTVIGVDDAGTVHVDWDNGSRLGVAFGADECQQVNK